MSDVAVIGAACRYPDAGSPAELWQNVLSRRRAFRRIPPERLRAEDYLAADRDAPDRTYSATAAVLEGWRFDRVRFRISGSTFRSTDLTHWLALEVAAAALADAGCPDGEGLDRERTLVVVGNTLTGEFSRAKLLRLRWPYVRRVVAATLANEGRPEAERRAFLEELERLYKAPFEPIDADTLAGGLSNTIAGRICNVFDLKGGGYTVDGACAASLLAVTTAAGAVARGEVDMAIAGGVDLSLDPFELVGFAKAGALAGAEMRVYDARPDGFWPGEGCGFVVLRRLDDAVREGHEPAVVIRGWGVSSDGAGGITRPEAAGQMLALRRAYAAAGFGVDAVDSFEGHGTGTDVGDTTELGTLDELRREAGAAGAAAIGSIKANIGHTKAAAGIAGFLKAVASLAEEVLPPAAGWSEPHPELRREGATLRVLHTAEAWPGDGPRRAAVSAMGFGGINTHVVLERALPRRRARGLRGAERRLAGSWQDAELFLFAGDAASVAADLAAVGREAGGLSLAELGDLAAELHTRLPRGEAELRAAVVAARPEELESALSALADALAAGRRGLFDRGVALGAGPAPRIGYLFTGQGAPASPDGGALARRFGWAREIVERASLGAPDDPVDTAFAQPAVVTASLAGLGLLRRLGVEGNCAVGHSLGELTALHWAGALDADDLVRLARERGRAMRELGSAGGAMASLATGAEEATRLVEGTGAVVAGLNAPRRTVVSGAAEAVAAVVARAEREGISATALRVSHAFHSPLVEAAAEPLRAVLEELPLRPLERRVLSTVTGAPLAPDADLRALLVRQVTSPVRFAEALAQVASEADVLVEVGPGRMLEGLAREATDLPVLALDAGGPALRPALETIGTLFALGAPLHLDELFRGRFTKPFVLGRERVFLASPCEAAPLAEPAPVTATAADDEVAEPDASESALEVVRELVARRAELPPDAVRADDRLLGELHLSSITVSEIAAAAAKRLGVAPPTAPGDLATATVAELAEALELLATTAPEPEPGLAAGVASWVRVYERVLVERPAPEVAPSPTQWHVVAPDHEPAQAALAAFAGGAGESGVVLVFPPGCEELAPRLVLAAARAVRERGAQRFLLVHWGEVGSSLARVVRAETGAHTCAVRLEDGDGLAAARREAETTSGYREVVLAGGTRRVPIYRPRPLGAGPSPVRPGGVLLATGGGKGIGAECALTLARSHDLALGLLGRADPRADEELADNLRRVEAAGIRLAYARADVADAPAVAAAVRDVEARLGPVTAVLHAAGVNDPTLLSDLTERDFRATLRPKVEGLRSVLAAVDPARLELVVTFGSILARMGIRGEAHYAWANERLGALVADLRRRLPGCRCLNVEWSVWAGLGMGEKLGAADALARAGVTAISVEDGVALLDELVRAPDLPSSVVATGRFGRPSTLELEGGETPLLRFLERPLVDYPGVELVAEAELSPATDPYLAEHALDGVALLPAVLGLEAMAQVAAALGVEAPLAFEDVALARPVTVPPDGSRRIRVAGLRRRDGAVEVVVRSDETGFQAEHFRAVCRSSAHDSEPRLEEPPDERIALPPDDVYDALLFHGPRFRRVRGYRALAARRLAADVEVAEETWFGAYLPQRLLLGDPGARDALVHALQACIPHARVLPVGVRRITGDGLGEGPLVVVAREREASGDTLVWDVEARGEDGRVRERWEGLTLRRIGALSPPTPWPAPLLAPYLERRLDELASAHVQVALARRDGPRRPRASDAAFPAEVLRRSDGRPELRDAAASAAHLDGYTLAVAAEGRVACDAEAATPHPWADLLGADRLALARALAEELDEELDTSAARVWAAVECARKTGLPAEEPLALVQAAGEGWSLLRAGRSPVATYATELTGLEPPVAFAFLVEEPR